MNREVHFELTERWALEEGFSAEDALVLAQRNWACDARYTDLPGKRYHWGLLGAPLVAWLRYRRAVKDQDLESLAEALHATQDTIGHGLLGHVWHWPGIDRLEHRGPGVRMRLEKWSRRLLAGYRVRVRERGPTRV